ncbi:hypothetical protein Tco_1254131 [Tanacetum coccineum]
MVEVVVDVQIWMVDVRNEVVVMNLKDPMANYPRLRHVGYEMVFVVERMKWFERCSYLKLILRADEVVKEISFMEVDMVFFHCSVPHLRI